MTQMFHQLLLSELHMVSYEPGDPAGMTDRLLCEALTLNENLRSLGFVLRPEDTVRISVSPSLDSFYGKIKSLVPDVKAEPMYPGFPQQVMGMSEAEFRLHQAIHYFSTYGIESLLGKEVHRGWLPESASAKRFQDDTSLLESRVIELVPEKEAPIIALKTILNRRERLTNPELSLVRECAPLCETAQLKDVKIRFKENLDLLFPLLMSLPERKAAQQTLRAVCAHTGDVLRCVKNYLSGKKYHLSTSEKKMLVRLLDSYPVKNLEENLMQSCRIRERNLTVLQHLDYNRFSKSAAHREKIRALRNGELLSWHAIGEKLLQERKPEALTHLAGRPGYAVRMLNRLLSLEYTEEEILQAMTPKAGSISGHLAAETISALQKRRSKLDEDREVALKVWKIKYRDLLREPVCREMENAIRYDAEFRKDEAYWHWIGGPRENLILESRRAKNELPRQIEKKKKDLEAKKAALFRLEKYTLGNRHPLIRQDLNIGLSWEDLNETILREMPGKLNEQIRQTEREILELQDSLKAPPVGYSEELEAKLEQLRAENEPHYQAEMREIDAEVRKELAALPERFRAELELYRKNFRKLKEQEAAELADVEKRYLHAVRISSFDPQAISVLKRLLKEHFTQVSTPLKGKRVFLDMESFDLKHSALETKQRSRDGGYIRSGIAWKIPEDAKYVRFFVYWNDRRRVDIDLHAGGITTDGHQLHVGWNSDYQKCGVVHSGDITHSNAAEYIDIDLSAPVQEIYANIHLYSGRRSLKDVETCYAGLMAVDRIGQDVKHYNPKNCFFTCQMTQRAEALFFGYIDVQNRYVRFVGQPNVECWSSRPPAETGGNLFSLGEYLSVVMAGQGSQIVKEPGEADLILTMGKNMYKNGISLIDHNFFLES